MTTFMPATEGQGINAFVTYLALAAICLAGVSRADVSLPAMFGEHAVLQRDKPVPIWGTATPRENITVSLNGQSHITTADGDGHWKATLVPMPASTSPGGLIVTANNEIRLQSAQIGEVWLGSGQSNMSRTIPRDAERDLATAEAANVEQPLPAAGYFAELQDRQGVFYTVDSETPFTGKSIVHYENGQKRMEGNFKDGKREGLHTMWHENGQKKMEGNFKDGKREGLHTMWHENGQKKMEGNFKDGKLEGLHTIWHENGQIDAEECYRNGEQVLLSECKNNSYDQGWRMLQNSDWEGAKAKFTTVIELVPDEWSAWLNRGVAKQNLGDSKGAMEDFNQAVKLDPEGYEVYLHRGRFRMRLGEWGGAIEDLDHGIQFLPNTRKFRQRLSSAYSDRSLAKGYVDDFTGAIKDWKKALELNPQMVKTLNGPGTPIIFRGSLGEVRDFIEIEPKVVLPKNLMGYTLLHLLMKSENPNSAEVCKILIEAGADVNAKEREGNTPLHFAMYRDTRMNLTSDVYLGTIRLLLEKGASVNAKNWIDGTPLHSAVLTNADLSAIELLLKNGAKVNAKTKAKGSYTALHPAASEGRADLVGLLLRNGADPNIKDEYGNTALDAARTNNQTEVVKILEHHGLGT